MALVANQAEIGIKSVGSTVHIADDPRAKLMFYLKCMCDVLDLDDPNMNRLTDYSNYRRLSLEEEGQLLLLCLMLSPDVLNGKCIFLDEDGDMCGNSDNAFFELSAVQNRLLVTQNIVIGNQQRHVKTIMAYKMSFITDKYLVPMVVLKPRLDALLAAREQRSTTLAITAVTIQPSSSNAPTYTPVRRKKFHEKYLPNCLLCLIFPPWCCIWFCMMIHEYKPLVVQKKGHIQSQLISSWCLKWKNISNLSSNENTST